MHFSNYIQYSVFYNPYTILMKNGNLLTTYKITHVENASKISSKLEELISYILTHYPQSLAHNLKIHLHNCRFITDEFDCNLDFNATYSQNIAIQWSKINRQTHNNTLYISIIFEISKNISWSWLHFIQDLRATKSVESFLLEAHGESFQNLSKIQKDVEEYLKEFKLELLSYKEILIGERMLYSEWLNFIYHILSGRTISTNYPLSIKELSEYFVHNKLTQDKTTLHAVLHNAKHDRFSSVSTIRDERFITVLNLHLPYDCNKDIMTDIMSKNLDLTLSTNINFQHLTKRDLHAHFFRNYTSSKMLKNENVLKQEIVYPWVYNKPIPEVNFLYSNKLAIYGNNQEELQHNIQNITYSLAEYGVLFSIHENKLTDTYFSLLPGHYNTQEQYYTSPHLKICDKFFTINKERSFVEDNKNSINFITRQNTYYKLNFYQNIIIYSSYIEEINTLTNLIILMTNKVNIPILYIDNQSSYKSFINRIIRNGINIHYHENYNEEKMIRYVEKYPNTIMIIKKLQETPLTEENILLLKKQNMSIYVEYLVSENTTDEELRNIQINFDTKLFGKLHINLHNLHSWDKIRHEIEYTRNHEILACTKNYNTHIQYHLNDKMLKLLL